MRLTYIYTKLQMSLAKLALVVLLEKHDKGLEALSEDLGLIVKDGTLADIYKTSMLMDYVGLLQEELELEFQEEQLVDELEELIKDIVSLILRYDQRMHVKPRAIHLELPNILVIEYPQDEPQPRPLPVTVRSKMRQNRLFAKQFIDNTKI